MPAISRYLITTADERTWKFDRPVIFLGEWCRVYERRHIWSQLDAMVAEPYGLGVIQKDKDHAQARDLEQQLLPILCDALNRYHGTQHGHRFWRIVLGHWLRRYVDVVFNRLKTIEQCLNTYNVRGTTTFADDHYHLATLDSHSFVWACNDDQWNDILCARIVRHLAGGTFLIETTPNEDHVGFRLSQEPESVPSLKRKVLRFGYRFVVNALSLMARDGYAFIKNSYLPLSYEIRLQLALGQVPQMWRYPQSDPIVSPDRKGRQMLSGSIAQETGNKLADVLRTLVFELMPVCYVEGFEARMAQVTRLSWPKIPNFIFTSNNYDTDEIFKLWTASKVEMGTPYFIGQHGNSGTHRYLRQTVEEETADKFLTWGWTDGLPQHTPAFVFRGVGRRERCHDEHGGLLLIELYLHHRITLWDSTAEFSEYWADQQSFVRSLDASARERLTIRLHGASRYHQWSEKSRWKHLDESIAVDEGDQSIWKLIASSRLVVHSYDSCGLIETLMLNIPTVVFWQNGLDCLRESAKPCYQLLIDAGILHLTPQSAAQKVNEVWDDVEGWWAQEQVQNARQLFCERYARHSDQPIKDLKRHLIQGVGIRPWVRSSS